jgi:hypothetical protein
MDPTQYTESEIRELKVDDARKLAGDNFEEPEGFRFAAANKAEMHEFLIANLETLNAILRGEAVDPDPIALDPPEEDYDESVAAQEWLNSDEAKNPNPTTNLR